MEVTVKNCYVNIGPCPSCDTDIIFNRKNHPEAYKLYTEQNLYKCDSCKKVVEFVYQTEQLPKKSEISKGNNKRH